VSTHAKTPWRGTLSRVSRFLAQSLGRFVLVIWGAATAGFVALRLIPGDPVDVMLGVQARVSESVRAQIRLEWGLDEPLITQYFLYLGRLIHGDLGVSYQLRTPVVDVLAQQALPTLQLAGGAIFLATLFALGGALFGRGARLKKAVSVAELIVISSPTYWIGLLLLAVFSLQLGVVFRLPARRDIVPGVAVSHSRVARGRHCEPSTSARPRCGGGTTFCHDRPLQGGVTFGTGSTPFPATCRNGRSDPGWVPGGIAARWSSSGRNCFLLVQAWAKWLSEPLWGEIFR